MLSKTELYLLSCNVGNTLFNNNPIAQQIENHYGFKSTYAPSTFIYSNGDIAIRIPQLGIDIGGEFNIFTKQ